MQYWRNAYLRYAVEGIIYPRPCHPVGVVAMTESRRSVWDLSPPTKRFARSRNALPHGFDQVYVPSRQSVASFYGIPYPTDTTWPRIAFSGSPEATVNRQHVSDISRADARGSSKRRTSDLEFAQEHIGQLHVVELAGIPFSPREFSRIPRRHHRRTVHVIRWRVVSVRVLCSDRST